MQNYSRTPGNEPLVNSRRQVIFYWWLRRISSSSSSSSSRWVCVCNPRVNASSVALTKRTCDLEQQAPFCPAPASPVALSESVCCLEQQDPVASSLDSDLHHVLSLQPSIATLASILRQCGASKSLHNGNLVHQHINRHRLQRNIFLRNCLVLMYAECGSMQDAQETFDRTASPNAYSWSILIKGYCQNDKLDEARRVFNGILNPDVVVWNTMMAAYAQTHNRAAEALDLFWMMQGAGVEPDAVTFMCALEACSSLATLEEVEDLLNLLSRSKYADDKLVRTALLTLLGKFGKLDQAWSIFDKSPHRDVVSWNAMIAAYAQNGHGKKALSLYFQMQRDGMANTPVTFVCALDACAGLEAVEEGRRIHAASVLCACDRDPMVGNALIHMYGKCRCLNEARDSFNRLPSVSVISWTAMMTACVDGKEDEEAIRLFHRMRRMGVEPNQVTFVCALDACANLAALEEGWFIHAAAVSNAHEQDVLVGTALVHMYGKSGLVNDARREFGRISEKDIASWNAMLTALSQSGHGKETLEHFDRMRAGGARPNNISFVCVLSVCSHMGWVNAGRAYFTDLCEEYGLRPTAEHWSCMIDLLGRAGCLEEVEDLLGRVHVSGQLASMWSSLLASCKTHGDTQRGVRAADHFYELDPTDPASFVILGNICAAGDD